MHRWFLSPKITLYPISFGNMSLSWTLFIGPVLSFAIKTLQFFIFMSYEDCHYVLSAIWTMWHILPKRNGWRVSLQFNPIGVWVLLTYEISCKMIMKTLMQKEIYFHKRTIWDSCKFLQYIPVQTSVCCLVQYKSDILILSPIKFN